MENNFTRTMIAVTKRLKKFNSQLNHLAAKMHRDPRIFGNYEVVQPKNVSPIKGVPPHITLPPYVQDEEEIELDDIPIKNKQEIEAIKLSCSLARKLLNCLGSSITVGVTTDDLDCVAHEFILNNGAYPSPLGFNGFPKSICTSVNNVIVHGIPDDRELKNGDIVTVDVSVYLNGFHGDCAETFLIGSVDESGRKLVRGAREILYAGIQCCGPQVPFNQIARKIEETSKQLKLTVIPSVTGHGIGKGFHEPPCIWHRDEFEYEDYDNDNLMLPGMVFTIEPAVSEGGEEAEMEYDGWTLTTADNSRAAQFEHTIAITDTGYEILTK